MTAARRRPPRGEAGSVTVLTMGVLFLLAALTLISVDLMRTVEAKARAQAAADAAALAAAQEILLPTGRDPGLVASDYAARNGASLASCRCDPGTFEAVVEVEYPLHLLFVGRDRVVRARARAEIEGGAAWANG